MRCKKWGGLVLVCTLLLAGCAQYSASDLVGNWEAISLTEEGDSLQVNLAEIGFEFNEQGGYNFSSTLNYEEAGTFRIDGPFLYSIDTTSSLGREKAVKIETLNLDTLTIRMREGSKDRLLTLQKVK